MRTITVGRLDDWSGEDLIPLIGKSVYIGVYRKSGIDEQFICGAVGVLESFAEKGYSRKYNFRGSEAWISYDTATSYGLISWMSE